MTGERAAVAPRASARRSPNHVAKRDAIVASTVEVLLREGVHGCTVRAIAANAGVAKGAVHYYFSDVDEIVDAAMLDATRAWVAWVRREADPDPAAETDSLERFWRAIASCLAPFASGDRTLMPLLLEYWAVCTRAQRVGPLREIRGLLEAHVAELLASTGVDDAQIRASGVASYLFGAGMQQSVVAVETEIVESDIAALCGLAAPARGSR